MRLAALKGFLVDHCVFVDSLPFDVGRCRTANFIIPEVTVSRNHCQITCENLQWSIKDFSSSGTYVNDKLVGKNSSRVLNEGDLIRLGSSESDLAWVFHPLNHDSLTNEKSNSKESVDITFQSQILTSCHMGKCLLQETSHRTKTDKITMNEMPDQKPDECNKKHLEIVEISSAITGLNKEIKKSTDENFKGKGNRGRNEMDKDVCSSEDNKAVTNNQSEEVKLKTNILHNFAELLEAELECTICSELLVNAVTLDCTHTFCQFCLDQWKKKQKLCPICRKKMKHQNRSLVLDNFIDKMVEQLPFELKERRKKIILERTETVRPPKKKQRMQ